jgi:hypothetical protein
MRQWKESRKTALKMLSKAMNKRVRHFIVRKKVALPSLTDASMTRINYAEVEIVLKKVKQWMGMISTS